MSRLPHRTALALVALCLALSGCGKKNGAGQRQPAPPDTHALLTTELIALTNTFGDTIAGVSDAEQARIAVPQLKRLSVDFEKLAQRMERIGLPSPEQRADLDVMISESKITLKSKVTRMSAVMLSKGNEEIGEVLHEGIDAFHKHLSQFEILEQWTETGGTKPPAGSQPGGLPPSKP